jgi:enoyl-CoA hydratase
MSNENSENLLFEKQGAIATVTINRPKALNALNSRTFNELLACASRIEADKEIRVVILTGSGEKAFVAGADIAEMAEMRPREARHFAEMGGSMMSAIETSHVPWIAAVHGFALGGGCELALACDFLYASKTAKLGQPEVNLGVIPGFGGTQRLMRRVGIAKAKELIFTGDMVDAAEGHRIGLVDAVIEPGELMAYTRKQAEKMAQKGPLALAEAKRVMMQGQSLALVDAVAAEAHAFASLFDTEDQREGMRAFLEKRPPRFAGR